MDASRAELHNAALLAVQHAYALRVQAGTYRFIVRIENDPPRDLTLEVRGNQYRYDDGPWRPHEKERPYGFTSNCLIMFDELTKRLNLSGVVHLSVEFPNQDVEQVTLDTGVFWPWSCCTLGSGSGWVMTRNLPFVGYVWTSI